MSKISVLFRKATVKFGVNMLMELFGREVSIMCNEQRYSVKKLKLAFNNGEPIIFSIVRCYTSTL